MSETGSWGSYLKGLSEKLGGEGPSSLACFQETSKGLELWGKYEDGFKFGEQQIKDVVKKFFAENVLPFQSSGIKINEEKFMYVNAFDNSVGDHYFNTLLFKKGQDQHFAISIAHEFVIIGSTGKGVTGSELLEILYQLMAAMVDACK